MSSDRCSGEEAQTGVRVTAFVSFVRSFPAHLRTGEAEDEPTFRLGLLGTQSGPGGGPT